MIDSEEVMGDGLATPTVEDGNHFFSDSVHDIVLPLELPLLDNFTPTEVEAPFNVKKTVKKKKEKKRIQDVRQSLTVVSQDQHLIYVNGSSWCSECAAAQESTVCPLHGPSPFIHDKAPPTLAHATLPARFRISYCDASKKHRGVFTNFQISPRTVFGPLIAEELDPSIVTLADPLYPTDEAVSSSEHLIQRFFLPVVNKSGQIRYLKRVNEDHCNWMMFVRPASRVEEQNCVVWQLDSAIYFSTVIPIRARKELRVWYAPNYAQFWNYPLLTPPLALRAPPRPASTPAAPEETRRSKRRRMRSVRLPPLTRSRPRRDRPKTSFKRLRRMQSTVRAARRMLRSAVRRFQKRKYAPPEPPDEMHCFDCGVTFSDDSLLRVHALSHIGFLKENAPSIGCQCSVCHMVFLTSPDYAAHALQHALAEPKVFAFANLSPEQGAYACGRCHQRMLSLLDLKRHKKSCRKHITPTEAEEAEKAKQVQEIEIPKREEVEELACRHCGQVFKATWSLATHEKSHTDKNAFFKCAICQLRMPRKEYMNHAQQHCQNGVFRCPICAGGKKRKPNCRGIYPTFSRLCRHMKEVHSSATLPCSHCHLVFRRRSLLFQHMRSHSTTDPFMCDVCGQTYRRRQALMHHMRSRHSTDDAAAPTRKQKVTRGYSCKICGLRYARQAMLTQHYTARHPGCQIPQPPPADDDPLSALLDVNGNSFSELFLSPSQNFVMEAPGEEAGGQVLYAELTDEPPAAGEGVIYLYAPVDGGEQVQLTAEGELDLSEFIPVSNSDYQVFGPFDPNAQVMIMDGDPTLQMSEVPITYALESEQIPSPNMTTNLSEGGVLQSCHALLNDQWML